MASNKKETVSIPNLLLLVLEKAVEGGELVVNSSVDLRRWIYDVYGNYPRPISDTALSHAIRRLRQRGLIAQESKRAEKIILKLTKDGRKLTRFLKDEKSNWDGRWRVVIFDIPEDKKRVRNILRWRLKTWGFVCWQKSVWATKRNIEKPLREFVKELEVEEWVQVLVAERE
ncbi:hypothetical protein HY404_04265 [Candidatus Microgenomates bacterium]|nr:hypothetical protein [Candidatus Microgenomates bacterium]